MEIAFHTFPNGKKYAYINQNGAPIFLRNIIFLHNSTNANEIAIVHEWGKPDNRWEPPKGQMEWKELKDTGIRPHTRIPLRTLYSQMKLGILREMAEEANIYVSEIKRFRRLPLSYTQDWPESGIPNAKFMYQYWSAVITPETMMKAQERIQQLVNNKDWQRMLPRDLCEKDNIQWWNPKEGYKRIRSGFSEKMTRLYFSSE